MKQFLWLFVIAMLANRAYSQEKKTVIHGEPIIVSAGQDEWEDEPALQLPEKAPVRLVQQRVKLSLTYDKYLVAMRRLASLVAGSGFSVSKTRQKEMRMARYKVEVYLGLLSSLEADFLQEKDLFLSDHRGKRSSRRLASRNNHH